MSFDIDVTRRLGDRTIAMRFQVTGGLTAVTGPSGAGKTSLMNMVAGLLTPDRGHIRVDGQTLFGEGINRPPEKRRLGYVFQDARLFPHRKVRANLLFGYRLAQPVHRLMSLDEVVGFLGIDALLERWPHSLSGGEAQRVAIGRALLSGPQALLMDEPLASVDHRRREEVMTAVEQIRDELHIPILYVTHDIGEADRLATHRVRLD